MQSERERVRGILAALNKARETGSSEIESLYYDILVPFEVADNLEPHDKMKREYFNVLNNAVTLLDLRDFASDRFFASVTACKEFLSKEFYSAESSINGTAANCDSVFVIGHAFSEADNDVFKKQIHLMDRYPWYKFMAGQPSFYKETEEKDPATYERIKARNAENRWETEGSMWHECDCNLSSGETIIRSILQGKCFFREEFTTSDNDVLWSPEVKGCTPSLPQILKKTRTKYFLTTGSRDERKELTDSTFLWRGIDGTGIVTHVLPEEMMLETSPVKAICGNLKAADFILGEPVLTFAGGAAGPDKDSLEVIKRLCNGLPRFPAVKCAYVKDYFKQVEKKLKDRKVSVWSGELPLKRYKGTYSEDSAAKKALRRTETALSDLEYFSTVSVLMNNTDLYPYNEIKEGYEKISCETTENFEDIYNMAECLSMKAVEGLTERFTDKSSEILTEDVGADDYSEVTASVITEKNYVYLYNSTSFVRDDVVELEGFVQVFDDENGTEIPVQFTTYGKTVCFVHDIPAKGYKTLRIAHCAGEPFAPEELSTEGNTYKFHTPLYFITFNKNFELIGIYDKLSKRDIFKGKAGANVLRAYEDRQADGYKGNIDAFMNEKCWRIDNFRCAMLTENGPVRYTVQVEREFNNSTIKQDISFYGESKKIDFRTEVLWREPDLLLKTFFPFDVVTDKAVYDVQFGNIERFTHENTRTDRENFEVFAHKWVDVSEYGYGVALINNGRYGCSVRGTTCSLTLINALNHGEICEEESSFTYSLLPHEGDFRTGRVVENGYFENVLLHVDYGNKPLFSTGSFFNGLPGNVVLETVKLPYSGNAIMNSENIESGEERRDVSVILRLYECFGSRTECTLNTVFNISDSFECDMLEYSLKRLDCTQKGVNLSFKPYEIKTIKLIIRN